MLNMETLPLKIDTPTLSVFSNFRINDEERFFRLKDSCLSFKDIDAVKWVINIRGKLKNETEKKNSS